MKILCRIALGIMISATTLLAADDGGTESPFGFGVGSRELALGGAAVAKADPGVAAYWNASALATAQYLTVTGFHSRLFESDVAYQYLGIAVPTLDFGALGLGVFRLGVDGIERRDDGNLLLGQFDDTRFAIYLGYGRRIAAYNVGVAVTLEHHSVDTYRSTSSPGVNLSVSRTFPIGLAWMPSFEAAVTGSNIVASSQKLSDASVSYPAKADVSIGIVLVPSSSFGFSLSAYGRASKTGSHEPVYAAGTEANLGELLLLRSGIRNGDLSFGAGVRYQLFSFDYALIERDLGQVHAFNVTLRFGAALDRRRQLRDQAREERFRNMMNEHLAANNSKLVFDLVAEGRAAADSGDYTRATTTLERALFLARTGALDTTEALQHLTAASLKLEQQQQDAMFRHHLETAQQQLAASDYIGAKYAATQALEIRPDDPEATALLSQSDEALREDVLREQMAGDKLKRADSLLTYNNIEGALFELRGLSRIAGADPRVWQTLQKAEFAYWREKATRELAAGNYTLVEQALDSAETRFPGHPWCESIRRKVGQKQRPVETSDTTTTRLSSPRLSREVMREAEEAYNSGKRSFEKGQLREAITVWERAELLAPGYQSVREHLVRAYKFVGVELYGKGRLEEAAATWRKALRLSPDNTEIAGYVRRVESEMSKLQELGYEQ